MLKIPVSRVLRRLNTYAASFLMSVLLLSCGNHFACADGNNSGNKKQHQAATRPDPGVDTAMVKTQTALFADPSIGATKISTLHPGDLTVLVSRDLWDGWIRVIHYESGRQGWVRANRMFPPVYTHHKNPSKVLNGMPLGTSDPPVIEVQNDSDINLYLHLDKLAEVYVSPHTTRTVSVQAGIFAFNASGPKVLPDFGYMAFLPGNKYPWRFFIGSARQHRSQSVLTPALTAEYYTLLAEVKVEQDETKIERQQHDVDKAALEKQSEKVKAESDDIDAKRPLLDHSDGKAVDDFNRLVGSANDDSNTYKKMLEQFNAKVDAFNAHLATLNAKRQRLANIEEIVNAAR